MFFRICAETREEAAHAQIHLDQDESFVLVQHVRICRGHKRQFWRGLVEEGLQPVGWGRTLVERRRATQHREVAGNMHDGEDAEQHRRSRDGLLHALAREYRRRQRDDNLPDYDRKGGGEARHPS